MTIKADRKTSRFTIASITLSVIGISCFLLAITIVISPFNMKLYHSIGSILFKLSLVFFPASFVLGIVGFFRKDSKVGVYAILSVIIGGLFTLLILLTLAIFAGYYLITKEKPIHKAAYKGDLKKVKQIIDRDPAQVNVQDWMDHTPLYLASCKGHTEIVDFLLAHNANTELGNNLNERPLAVAAEFGHYNTVKTLLMHGAAVNCKNVFDQTPLHEAALRSGKDVINILISYGADVSAKDDDNDTPLHNAVMQNNIEAVEALVEHGADLFAKNDFDYAKLYIAATQDNNEAAKEMLSRGSLFRDYKNKTPKELALKCGRKELAQYLQKKEDEKRLGVK
jgi:ankyrin repeat protein